MYPAVALTEIYHPTIGADHTTKVPTSSLGIYLARGWLQVAGGGLVFPRAAVAVVHGTDPNMPRPLTLGPVIWYGTTPPVNADDTLDVYEPVQADTDGVTP